MFGDATQYLYDYLTEWGDDVIEGDYSRYDTSMPVEVGLYVNKVVYCFCKKRGFSNKRLRVLSCILRENLFPTLMINKEIVVVPGMQPSGKYGTAEDNSLRGLFLMIYFFGIVCTDYGTNHPFNVTTEYEVKDFFDFMHPAIYGDDLLCGVHFSLKKFINGDVYSKFCKYEYGMEFTSGDKNSPIKPFVNIREVMFLKRRFVWNPRLRRETGVLDYNSYCKMLMYTMPSPVASHLDQLCDAMRAALHEYYFAEHSVVLYNKTREGMLDILSCKFRIDRRLLMDDLPYFSHWDKKYLTPKLKNVNNLNNIFVEMDVIKEDHRAEVTSTPGREFVEDMRDGDFAALTTSQLLSRRIFMGSVSFRRDHYDFKRLNPWEDWVSGEFIRSKLKGYYNLSCKLKLVFSTNADITIHGKVYAVYIPFPRNCPTYRFYLQQKDYLNSQKDADLSKEMGFLCWLSQQQYLVEIEFGSSEVEELIIPHLLPEEKIPLTLDDDGKFDYFKTLGEVVLMTVVPCPIEASEDQVINITIQAVDVVIDTPTATPMAEGKFGEKIKEGIKKVGNALQGTDEANAKKGDEFNSQGPVAKIASNISEAAGQLKDVPVLGGIASAVELGANKFRKVLNIFGFSKPLNIDKYIFTKPRVMSNMVYSTFLDNAIKLSMDSRSLLNLKSMSKSSKDELVINEITKRKTLIAITKRVKNDKVLLIPNSPQLPVNMRMSIHSGAGLAAWPNMVQHTTLSTVAMCFDYWRGDIDYWVEFVCSDKVRGKYVINYEPNAIDGNFISLGTNFHRQNHVIVDLEVTRKVRVRVGMTSGSKFGLCAHHSDLWHLQNRMYTEEVVYNENHMALLGREGLCKGYLKIMEYQKPQYTNYNADVTILIYQSSENMEFSVPKNFDRILTVQRTEYFGTSDDTTPRSTNKGVISKFMNIWRKRKDEPTSDGGTRVPGTKITPSDAKEMQVYKQPPYKKMKKAAKEGARDAIQEDRENTKNIVERAQKLEEAQLALKNEKIRLENEAKRLEAIKKKQEKRKVVRFDDSGNTDVAKRQSAPKARKEQGDPFSNDKTVIDSRGRVMFKGMPKEEYIPASKMTEIDIKNAGRVKKDAPPVSPAKQNFGLSEQVVEEQEEAREFQELGLVDLAVLRENVPLKNRTKLDDNLDKLRRGMRKYKFAERVKPKSMIGKFLSFGRKNKEAVVAEEVHDVTAEELWRDNETVATGWTYTTEGEIMDERGRPVFNEFGEMNIYFEMAESEGKYTWKLININDPTEQIDDLYQHYFGERVNSFRALMKMDNHYCSMIRKKSSSDLPNPTIYHPLYPLQPRDGFFTNTFMFPHVKIQYPEWITNTTFGLFDHLRNNFLFMAGGMRYRFIWREGASSGLNDNFVTISLGHTSPGFLGGLQQSAYFRYKDSSPGQIFDVQSEVPEVEIPFICRHKYTPCFYSLSSNFANPKGFYISGGRNNIARVNICPAEDFNFMFFTGGPLYRGVDDSVGYPTGASGITRTVDSDNSKYSKKKVKTTKRKYEELDFNAFELVLNQETAEDVNAAFAKEGGKTPTQEEGK